MDPQDRVFKAKEILVKREMVDALDEIKVESYTKEEMQDDD